MTEACAPEVSVSGQGPAVVLVPGMDGTGQLFHRQVPLLSRSYRVATYALRNDAPSMDVLVGDLARTIDEVGPLDGRAIVIGESFGGALALSLALAAPERVRALVVLNSFPHFTPQFRLRLAYWGLSAVPWGVMGLVRRLTAFRMHSRHTHDEDIQRFMELTARASRAGYLNRLGLLRQYDVRNRLHEIRGADALSRRRRGPSRALRHRGSVHGRSRARSRRAGAGRARPRLPDRARPEPRADPSGLGAYRFAIWVMSAATRFCASPSCSRNSS